MHSPEELRMLVMQTSAHGLLDESDRSMLAGVFDFHFKKAGEHYPDTTHLAGNLFIYAVTVAVLLIKPAGFYGRE